MHHNRTKKKVSGVSNLVFYAQSTSMVIKEITGRGKWNIGNVSLQFLISMKSPAVGVEKAGGGGGYGWMDGKGQNGKVQAHKTCGSRQKQFRFSFLSTAPHGRVPR